jgi:hypothetical protein
MQMFLLVQIGNKPEDRVVRGVFTTSLKAKNHDAALKGMWTTGPGMGWFEVNTGSLSGSHHVIKPIHANEEIDS